MTARDDEPAPLAEGARRIVDAARPFERLPPDRKARVRGRVMAAVAAGAVVSAVATEAAAAGAGASAAATAAAEAGAGAEGALGSAGLGSATKAAGVSLFAKIGLSVALVTAGAGGWIWSRAHQEAPPSPSMPVATLAAGPSAGDTGAPNTFAPAEPGATSAPVADPPAPGGARSNTVSEISPVSVPATPAGAGADKPQAAVDPAASSPPVDSLPEETRLLAAAHAALSRGDAAAALVLIDEHAARFPSGALAPERRAARAMALCKQGRAADGQREADALYGEGSKSPVAEKIRRACAK